LGITLLRFALATDVISILRTSTIHTHKALDLKNNATKPFNLSIHNLFQLSHPSTPTCISSIS
jgi:hypothetical protein